MRTNVVIDDELEVLQGSKTEKDYRTLKKYLDTQIFYDLKNGKKSYAEVAKMYLNLNHLQLRPFLKFSMITSPDKTFLSIPILF